MKSRVLAVSVASTALLLGNCGGSSPSQPTTPPAAVATPTPTPAPTATPSRGNPAASVTARMFGYTRNAGTNQGRFPIPPAPPYFQQGDFIDIDCTPRDQNFAPTGNHPAFAEWYYSSGGAGVLIDKLDYQVIDDSTYTPQVQIRYLSRTGFIDIYCKLPGTSLTSNVLHIDVRGVIR